jgi:dTDP-4-dehydrorhamnose 3,5-epimerase
VKLHPVPLPGVLLLEPRIFSDERGRFFESWRKERYEPLGVRGEFVQDNFSSSRRGTLRGLHYQLRAPQAKLVFVTRGEVWDVAVDIRVGSPTFKQWFGTTLSAENGLQMYLPEGFAHGFVVTSESADFAYKVTAPYAADDDRSIRWDDPELAVGWPALAGAPVLSGRDAAAPGLREALLPRYHGIQ